MRPRRADADRGAGKPGRDAALEETLQVDRDVGTEVGKLAGEVPDGRGPEQPAPGETDDAIHRRVVHEHVAGAALDGPRDLRRGPGPLDRDGGREGVHDVADRRQPHDEHPFVHDASPASSHITADATACGQLQTRKNIDSRTARSAG